jgi:hypothetical protein
MPGVVNDFFKKKVLFISCAGFSLHVCLHIKRGHQISLEMVVSHHMRTGNLTQYLWKNS